MGYREKAHEKTPTVFYRVQDASSRAQYQRGDGINSRSKKHMTFDPQSPRTCEMLESHLDWYSRRPSTFISVYSNSESAANEARRRVEHGFKDVVTLTINTQRGRVRAKYRNVTFLAENCGIEIHEKAQHNSEYEWLFLHYIPEKMIVGVKYGAVRDYHFSPRR